MQWCADVVLKRGLGSLTAVCYRQASMSALRPFPVRRKRRDFNNEIPFEVHIRVSEDEPRRNGSQQKVEGTARIVHRARTFLL